MDVLLPLLWDHKRLGAEASRPFVFSPDSPVLKLDIGEQASAGRGTRRAPSPGPLFASPRLLPLGGGSLAIMAPALPGADAWGEELAGAMLEGTFWFLKVVLAHHDAAGEPLLSTLSVSYGWRDGKLLGHRYYWQKGTGLVRQPEGDNLDSIAIRSVMAPARRSEAKGDDDSVSTLLHCKLGRPPADRRAARYSYAAAPPHPLTLAEGAAPAPGPALHGVTAAGGAAAESSTGERGIVELVYGGGEAYVMLPADLRAAAEAAGARPGAGHEGGRQVAFDFFAADGPGGLVRCTVAYDAAPGGRRAFGGTGALPLLHVQHEVC
ncbi:hypothetical protein MNEG_15553 [Monoraphidium neglectum]|uniref:Uncharacterized protein n=1 Tax=Monoraphidium neglectum TaxID=145388 RepID=A0A0D2MAN4_9CHLO|nr:hypothetical protein MNEG_15553 [Monoraphidium neglectum]KIY92410.1 hypothetical protein MNEG_15553 [Monoraphidium neglectum]|eukprot:XP_013891430.1 hypothetical protein MNEG_15553 [Monoraphidium neglectum]